METHRLAHAARERWAGLQVGQDIMVVKRSPEGAEVARYPAVLLERGEDDDWVALKARWTYKRVEIDGLIFDPGDDLIEWFSPVLPFNAFAVLSPEGVLRGWYANVTYPAFLEPAADNSTPTLVWHDLYLDLVGLPDATFVVRDEDELAESGLAASDPLLHREIGQAAVELARRFESGDLPFRLLNASNAFQFDRRESQNESV